jgi:hypothetical protein
MRTLLSFVAAAFVLAAQVAYSADGAKGEWTGYITDTHCGANGANKDHTAACVEKCVKGGSKVELYVEADKKSYPLNDFSKVKALVGQKVTIKGSKDADTGLITIESASKASS